MILYSCRCLISTNLRLSSKTFQLLNQFLQHKVQTKLRWSHKWDRYENLLLRLPNAQFKNTLTYFQLTNHHLLYRNNIILGWKICRWLHLPHRRCRRVNRRFNIQFNKIDSSKVPLLFNSHSSSNRKLCNNQRWAAQRHFN